MKKSIIILLLVAILYFAFFQGGKTGYPGENIPGVDPYMEFRRHSGPYSAAKWNGIDNRFRSGGFRVIASQDYPAFDETMVLHAMHAFIKGYNIHPSTWQMRSVLAHDFRAFLVENQGGHPDLVAVGSLLQP